MKRTLRNTSFRRDQTDGPSLRAVLTDTVKLVLGFLYFMTSHAVCQTTTERDGTATKRGHIMCHQPVSTEGHCELECRTANEPSWYGTDHTTVNRYLLGTWYIR